MVRRTVVSRCVARTTTGRFDGRGRCDACKETVVNSAKKQTMQNETTRAMVIAMEPRMVFSFALEG